MTSIRPFALERYFDRYEFNTPHMLSASDCETVSVGELLSLAGVGPEALTELRLGYTETQGEPALRAAIAGLYRNVAADDVVVTTAPAEALFLAMHTMASPGARVVTLAPCYQSLKDVAAYRGCDVVPWNLVETDAGWEMDLGALERLLAQPTALLVVNFPHNPTGALPDERTFRQVVDMALARGTCVFSDEMYRGLEPAPGLQLPAGAELDTRVVSLWGLSKTFGLPGLRIGWLVVRDPGLRHEVMKLKDYTTLCSSAPGELLARLALGVADRLTARSRERVRRNSLLAAALAGRHERLIRWHPPAGGPVTFARLREGSAAAFCERVREQEGVLLVPSTLFDWGDSHLRFGLGREAVPAALQALERALERL